jgi:hypothetical protein
VNSNKLLESHAVYPTLILKSPFRDAEQHGARYLENFKTLVLETQMILKKKVITYMFVQSFVSVSTELYVLYKIMWE